MNKKTLIRRTIFSILFTLLSLGLTGCHSSSKTEPTLSLQETINRALTRFTDPKQDVLVRIGFSPIVEETATLVGDMHPSDGVEKITCLFVMEEDNGMAVGLPTASLGTDICHRVALLTTGTAKQVESDLDALQETVDWKPLIVGPEDLGSVDFGTHNPADLTYVAQGVIAVEAGNAGDEANLSADVTVSDQTFSMTNDGSGNFTLPSTVETLVDDSYTVSDMVVTGTSGETTFTGPLGYVIIAIDDPTPVCTGPTSLDAIIGENIVFADAGVSCTDDGSAIEYNPKETGVLVGPPGSTTYNIQTIPDASGQVGTHSVTVNYDCDSGFEWSDRTQACQRL